MPSDTSPETLETILARHQGRMRVVANQMRDQADRLSDADKLLQRCLLALDDLTRQVRASSPNSPHLPIAGWLANDIHKFRHQA